MNGLHPQACSSSLYKRFYSFLSIILLLFSLSSPNSVAKTFLLPSTTTTTHSFQRTSSSSSSSLIILRGGGSDEEDASDYESEYDVEESDTTTTTSTSNVILSKLFSITQKTLILLGRASLKTAMAVPRALKAGFFHPKEKDEDSSLFGRMVSILGNMWNVVFGSTTNNPEGYKSKQHYADFGSYLEDVYNVESSKNDANDNDEKLTSPIIMGGSLNDALRECRSKSRFLVVFIPSSNPTKATKTTETNYDQLAIRSLRSNLVYETAEAKKGYYLFWGAKHASSEAVLACKRLKAIVDTKKKVVPVLVVVYPAQVMDPTTGTFKVTPKLLAQHHCNPPPSAESLSAWLNALRKRHSKLLLKMRRDAKESELFLERQQNYQQSLMDDTQRELEEQRLQKEEERRLREEKARLEQLEERRTEFLANLPPEPETTGTNVVTIALRFPDGRNGQRRFLVSESMEWVFNWVDGEFGMEREKVILSTMNGRLSFKLDEMEDEMTIGDAGLGKMCALRVSPVKEEEKEEEEEETKNP